MGALGGLVAVCVAMAVVTFVVGTLPLAFRLSRSALRKLELWGSGLLLGAALTVVIPEGVSNVYQGRQECRDGRPVQVSDGYHAKDVIAVCLLSGFLLMLAVDQYTTSADAESETNTPGYDDAHSLFWNPRESSVWLPTRANLHDALQSTLGLLIHALADGVAMGASVGSADTSLRIVVVLAIMVHKAPASIGTCTLLMSRQLRRADIRWAVLAFSLATPVGALVTYALIQLVFRGTQGSTIQARDIGAILSFSGGTFLYVAMHAVLGLTVHASPKDTAPVHRPHDQDHPIHARPISLDEHALRAEDESIRAPQCLLLVALGSVTPRLLQLLIGDHHLG